MPQMKDSLRPSPEQSATILNKSRRSWGGLLAWAHSASGFPSSCANVNGLLHQTPSLPSRSIVEDSAGDILLHLQGFSVWCLGSLSCDLADQNKKSRLHRVVIGSNCPNFCHISNESSSGWMGFEDFCPKSTAGNYVFAFVLGWSYVLSAQLVELRKESDKDQVSYTEQKAPLATSKTAASDNNRFPIPIGSVDTAECRWWTAILASGCGWQAVLHRSGREFYPSWTCHLHSDERFQVHHDRLLSSSSTSACPPSSTLAQQYLYNFAKLHNAYDQLLAGFIATLTLPREARFCAPITLPRPEPMSFNGDGADTTLLSLLPSAGHLPHFMAFSCVPNTITSCMLGCLWEPKVICNLASQWLCPILQEVLPGLTREKRFHIIVRMMAGRRPNSAPLWLGSAITGLLPRLFEVAGSYMPSISLEASQWTQSQQLFMDPPCYQKARFHSGGKGRKFIRREDEFRLLYLTDLESERYPSPPSCPWLPFGMSDVKTAAIEVQKHAFCEHQLTYDHWIWHGDDGGCIQDHGAAWRSQTIWARGVRHRMVLLLFRVRARLRVCWRSRHGWSLIAPGEAICSEAMSRSATQNLFTWTLSDGTKPEESAMWTHEWLENLLDAVYAEDEEDDDTDLELASST